MRAAPGSLRRLARRICPAARLAEGASDYRNTQGCDGDSEDDNCHERERQASYSRQRTDERRTREKSEVTQGRHGRESWAGAVFMGAAGGAKKNRHEVCNAEAHCRET